MLIDEREVHMHCIRMSGVAGQNDTNARSRTRMRSDAGRAVTCEILGRYLGVRGSEVHLTTSVYGKPQLAAGNSHLHFNQSHSGNLLVLAVALGIEVGVDVEHVRSMPRALEVAKRFFHSEEVAQLGDQRDAELHRAFFHCWTQKEAYLKAIGLGLHADLQSFRVACDPAAPASIEWITNDDAACWQMSSWQPAPEYVAALAVRDRNRRLQTSPLLLETKVLAGDWAVSNGEDL